MPLGAGGSKKIKDFFVDSRVPLRKRHRIPLLLFGNRIAWVCGLRIDERFKVKSGITSALRVQMV